MNKFIKKMMVSLLTTGLLSSVIIANADDTDIINIDVPTNSNVLFVMDMSGSMGLGLDGTEPSGLVPSRKEILHDALRTVLNAPELATLNINVGLASFAGNGAVGDAQRGHGISYPITPLTADAAPRLDSNAMWNHQSTIYDGVTVTSYLPLAGLRTSIGYMGDAIPAGWTPVGGTPVVDALYEAALYFRGGTVDFGKAGPSRINSAHPSTYTGLLYYKTPSDLVPGPQECGGTTGIECNPLTFISCPSTTDNRVCSVSDSSCQSGYTCGAAYSPTPDPNFSCDYDTCSVTSGCISTNGPTPTTTDVSCTLASETLCENENNDRDGGSCTARVIPEVLAVCNHWNAFEVCDGYTTPTPATTVYDCTETKGQYSCPSNPENEVACSQVTTICHHMIGVPAGPILEGTATYNSPITEECPNNSIILLSDGKPTLNNSAVRVASMVGGSANGCSAISGANADIDYAGRCGKELTNFLANTDNNTTVAGDQFITTHAIGLALNNSPENLEAKAYLQELAFNGGGQFINASTPEGLVAALLNTITSNTRARSFASPTYTGSASSMSHGEYVYLPVFNKSAGPVWPGNLKKYKRSGGRLVDADGIDATDPLGMLKFSARDFWSSSVSTNAILSGGVANKIPAPDARTLYTDAGVADGVNFSGATELKTANASITKTLLGNAAMTAAERNNLIEFIRGKKSDGTARTHMGDIIHSKPVQVVYPGSKRLFVGTNEGYLHAIDEGTGVEQFAFMPSVLLKNISPQFQNDALSAHVYGVDGAITLHHKDGNSDGIVNGADTAVLYFGLRRGGKAYYALDVTDPAAAPKLKWKIKQGGDFSNLGYSWSKPVVAKIKHDYATVAEPVVVFGGGYVNDNGGEADDSGTGADVFIVKASDGSLVWRLSDSSKTALTNGGVEVDHAVPGNIRVMDISRNGLLDRLYFGDTGGNIWRVDFESNLTGLNSAKAKLKRFADLGGVAPKRKFFTEPDVALFKSNGRLLISVAIGSGQRPKPLDSATDDHFFMMFDTDVRQSPTSTTPTITKATLKDATLASVTGVLSGGKKGWYMDLVAVNGEKVLSRATTYNNRILFNTFGVSSVSASLCGSNNVNQSRLYVVDIMTAKAVIDLDKDNSITPDSAGDRHTETAIGEIPGAPQVLFEVPTAADGSACVPGNCRQEAKINAGGKGLSIDIPFSGSEQVKKAYWIDKE